MIKPLREAYENYERMRLEEESVKSATVDSLETSTTEKGLKASSDVQMFRDKKASRGKMANKEQEKLTHSFIKNQVLLQDGYFTYIMCWKGRLCVCVCACVWRGVVGHLGKQ